MIKQNFIRTWLKRLSVMAFLLVASFFVVLSCPELVYKHKTAYKNLTIHHNQELDESIFKSIDNALSRIGHSEIVNESLRSDFCLNDGSIYPKLVEGVLGQDIFAAFANKVIVFGEDLVGENFDHWGLRLSTSQFLAHGLMHNHQFAHHGFFDANPLGGYENWKWEGYVEYTLFKDQLSQQRIIQLLKGEEDQFEMIALGNGYYTIKEHLRFLLVVKYLIEEQELTYDELMYSKEDFEMLYLDLIKTY